jgi:hypothetical protein
LDRRAPKHRLRMAVNLDKPQLWKADILKSVDMYNDWFMKFAPKAFRETRIQTTKDVESTLRLTANLTNLDVKLFRQASAILPTLRMATCPPLAVDRLIGLASASKTLVKALETGRMPTRMPQAVFDSEVAKITNVIAKMADPDILIWLGRKEKPKDADVHRAATIIADRLCGSVANPIIKNAQEKRQLASIQAWLIARGYKQLPAGVPTRVTEMPPGTFGFRMNVPVKLGSGSVNIPIDATIMPKKVAPRVLPVFFEAKSAGDFTNPNKRRKEEATKMTQLRATYGKGMSFNLFLCGYFDSGYLGYEAAEGIDWVWEHRIDDLASFGI